MKKNSKTNTEQYTRLNSRADLDRLAEASRDLVSLRHEQAERDPKRKIQVELLVCGGTGCHSMEAGVVIENLQKALVDHNVDWAKVVQVGCLGFCAQGPIVLVMPDNIFYVKVQPEDAERIVTEHVIKNEIINDLIYVDPETGEYVPHHADMSFYRKQKRVALRNCGLIDPEEILESIAVGGYQALAKCLFDYTPQEVIDVLKASGLRGRGGAGFPTGVKWQFAANNHGEKKYVICNGDEGDPGAFMDRSIMEDDPNSVVEAMTIAGYAIGAHDGLIYVRAEYPVAVWRLQTAIHEARMLGLLGKNILGSGFDFDIKISLGAGAFVCGEETALIHSAEGHRGEPTRKPPFPAESGYMGLPTIVNNVETFANVPIIITKGAEWFSSIGTEHSKGTKVFALAGHVNNIGLVEVPMGTTLREIVFEIGGGVPDGKAFKAVQTGGPSGGVITTENLDTPIDFQSLGAIGSMMGSGGMIVMNEDNDMVEVARFYLDFTCDE
ncbi:MAG: NADH-quinone oxidoreductase subunit J/K, partial [Clostridiaceae bacterium]|nr:NADH-quinone oxidoreductase subunit J/K [Clostridiaceae bacterium]